MPSLDPACLALALPVSLNCSKNNANQQWTYTADKTLALTNSPKRCMDQVGAWCVVGGLVGGGWVRW